jgi:hypothetical protein
MFGHQGRDSEGPPVQEKTCRNKAHDHPVLAI